MIRLVRTSTLTRLHAENEALRAECAQLEDSLRTLLRASTDYLAFTQQQQTVILPPPGGLVA